MAYATTSPCTSEVEKRFADATDAEVEQALASAQGAFLT